MFSCLKNGKSSTNVKLLINYKIIKRYPQKHHFCKYNPFMKTFKHNVLYVFTLVESMM